MFGWDCGFSGTELLIDKDPCGRFSITRANAGRDSTLWLSSHEELNSSRGAAPFKNGASLRTESHQIIKSIADTWKTEPSRSDDPVSTGRPSGLFCTLLPSHYFFKSNDGGHTQ